MAYLGVNLQNSISIKNSLFVFILLAKDIFL